MKRLVVLLSLFLLAVTARQDLSGQMFTFPVESNTAHVSLIPEEDRAFFAVTVCLRAFTDVSRAQCLFSLALSSNDNGFVVYKSTQEQYSITVLSSPDHFWGLPGELNVWNSVCATWDGSTGLTQVWVNGNPSSRKGLKPGDSLMGRPIIILGQEQDSYGGSFDIAQSFVGMLTDVNMWDSVLSPQEIIDFTHGLNVQTGNVLNWTALEFNVNGYVITESRVTSLKPASYHIQK